MMSRSTVSPSGMGSVSLADMPVSTMSRCPSQGICKSHVIHHPDYHTMGLGSVLTVQVSATSLQGTLNGAQSEDGGISETRQCNEGSFFSVPAPHRCHRKCYIFIREIR